MLGNRTKYKSTPDAFEVWKDHMVNLGFGYKLDVDLPSEKRGFIPNSKYYSNAFKTEKWNAHNVISIAIGQGEVLTTPLQLANFSAIIANPSTSSTEYLNTVRWALAASIASTALVAVISGESLGLANVFDDRVAMMIRAKFKLPPMCKLFVDAEQILDGLPSHQAPTHFGK